MKKYILKRILIMIPVLLLVTIFCFGIVQLAPGDPADLYADPNATVEQIALTREKLGLDQPVPVQYVKWLGNTLQGDLGFSFNSRLAVTKILTPKIVSTLQLLLGVVIVSYGIGIPLGIACAKRKNKLFDVLTTSLSFMGISIPNFFIGLLLIYVFSLQLRWLPTSGKMTLGGGGGLLDLLRHMVMPVVVLSIFYCSNMTRYVRATMIGINSENYMRTAIAKGLPESEVLRKHGLRNALIPVITIIGGDIPKLIGGAVITETIFAWPGIGMLMITSINARDYPVIMAINLLCAFAVLICNLLVDIFYAVADPRIRY